MSKSVSLQLMVNHQLHTVEVEPDTPLLYVLRNDLELNGPKFGCGLGECGACTVLVNGIAARACLVSCDSVKEYAITTLEGLSVEGKPNPVQQAFIENQAAQCGYCLNGMIMTTQALLLRNPDPTEDEIRQELRYNLCRCGTHLEILDAARAAVQLNKTEL